ncbi:MAG TPA: hypothetical protein VGC71_02195 [Gaiellales bacterium]|jgi:hypothetical protein
MTLWRRCLGDPTFGRSAADYVDELDGVRFVELGVGIVVALAVANRMAPAGVPVAPGMVVAAPGFSDIATVAQMTRLIADGHTADALDAPRPREMGEIERPDTWAAPSQSMNATGIPSWKTVLFDRFAVEQENASHHMATTLRTKGLPVCHPEKGGGRRARVLG